MRRVVTKVDPQGGASDNHSLALDVPLTWEKWDLGEGKGDNGGILLLGPSSFLESPYMNNQIRRGMKDLVSTQSPMGFLRKRGDVCKGERGEGG